MHRLFAAIRPPEHIRKQLLDVMDGIRGARWQDDAQLHITLRFIGEVERHQAVDIAVALGSARFSSFEVALNGVGKFESGGRRGSLWVGLTPHEQLKALHKKVDSALRQAGVEPEHRAYLPHITIARLNSGTASPGEFIADHAAISSEAFAVDSLCLFESFLGDTGARYEIVERYPLR